jgi:hypothetical protein
VVSNPDLFQCQWFLTHRNFRTSTLEVVHQRPGEYAISWGDWLAMRLARYLGAWRKRSRSCYRPAPDPTAP